MVLLALEVLIMLLMILLESINNLLCPNLNLPKKILVTVGISEEMLL